MTDPVKWGVLGASKFAREQMAPAIHMAAGADLYALATSRPEAAASFAPYRPGLKIHDSYEALLADPEIEAVYIPMPNHLHVEWTLKALEAGKNVLCEKPIAMRASEIDRIIAARDATGLLAAEAFMIVHHPQWIRTKELVADGAIGQLVQVDGTFSYDNRADPGNIRNRQETGGGSIPDIGVYTMGSTRFVTGEEPLQVHPHIRRENGVDVYARVTAEFPSFSFMSATSMRMSPRQEMTFQGEAGLLRLTAPFNAGVFNQAVLELHRPDMTVLTERWPAENHYIHQVENFGRTLRDGAPYPNPLEFSKGTQAMIDMVFAAEP